MDEDLELAPPPLQPAHRRQVGTLSACLHVGLLLIGASAVWTLQPALASPRQWAPYLLVAVLLLACAAITRGRCAFTDGGRLLTGLGAALVFRLARDPQLANLPALSDTMPAWAQAIAPGLGTLGLIIAAISGLLYVRTLDSYLGHGHVPPLLRALNWSAALILGLSVVTFFTLSRFYELDSTYLIVLLAGTIQYYLLVRVALTSSGRMMVGAMPQIYLAVALLGAFAHNVLAGVLSGGEGP